MVQYSKCFQLSQAAANWDLLKTAEYCLRQGRDLGALGGRDFLVRLRHCRIHLHDRGRAQLGCRRAIA